ncbi:HEXXH motif domain-containing protein [Actinomadura welshii]|uniref:HEXXH motif domain-containing protein n=1 Tax=Actinomadura welshii TaxID=3103817 RepID=UPI0003FD6B22|nr:HEXXH motif domain-containing protein [Actinomadura madurae]
MNESLITSGDLESLARGFAAPGTIKRLRSARATKTLLGLRVLLERAPSTLEGMVCDHLWESYSTLARIQRSSPELVAWYLSRPHTGAWVTQCLRLLDRGPGNFDPENPTPWLYLGSVAAAAAIDARETSHVVAPMCQGAVRLPSVGRVQLSDSHRSGTASVDVTPEETSIRGGSGAVSIPTSAPSELASFIEVRRVRIGRESILDVELDEEFQYGLLSDTYPKGELVGRLDEPGYELWHRSLEAAWELLESHHREHAEAIAIGLRSIVPLRTPRHGTQSFTSDAAFGAIATSRPSDPHVLAVTLVHEFQHAKLSVILDAARLYRGGADDLFYAPWRDDPRPLGPFLHGIYAHLGVAQFWNAHRRAVGASDAVLANVELARWRDQTWQAVSQLDAYPYLTEAGRAFVDGIKGALRTLLDQPIDQNAKEHAEWAAADHRVSWRLRNRRLSADIAAKLAAEWIARFDAPTVRHVDIEEVNPPRTADPSTRLRLLYDRLKGSPDGQGGTEPDTCYVNGDFRAASAGYRHKVTDRADDFGAWAGLVLSEARTHRGTARDVLLHIPEVVVDVYRRLPADVTASLPQLAVWLRAVEEARPGHQPADNSKSACVDA